MALHCIALHFERNLNVFCQLECIDVFAIFYMTINLYLILFSSYSFCNIHSLSRDTFNWNSNLFRIQNTNESHNYYLLADVSILSIVKCSKIELMKMKLLWVYLRSWTQIQMRPWIEFPPFNSFILDVGWISKQYWNKAVCALVTQNYNFEWRIKCNQDSIR